MILIQRLLSRAFPLMALTGLLLAGWGLIVTPDEFRGEIQTGTSQVGLWGERVPASLIAQVGIGTTGAWRE